MTRHLKPTVWFNEVTKKDIPLVGGKGANLGEMTNAGIPVSPGFIVTTNAYLQFLKEAGLTEKIRHLLAPLDPDNSKQLQDISAKVKDLIIKAKMPPDLAEEIRQHYVKMGKGLVAVRTSTTTEDLPDASFAGHQATFLNVEGEKEVVIAVQKCWASLFEVRAIFHRVENKFDHFKVGIAVSVQKLVSTNSSSTISDDMSHYQYINANQQVIIVHGHKYKTIGEVASYVQQLGYTPIVLEEVSDGGCSTVIEKFEKVALAPEVAYAIVIYESGRANIDFEFGWLVRHLGRQRVSIIMPSAITKMPSDYSGLLFIKLDSRGNWRSKLAKNMSDSDMAFTGCTAEK
jgi:predicted nucleotide-binding protein